MLVHRRRRVAVAAVPVFAALASASAAAVTPPLHLLRGKEGDSVLDCVGIHASVVTVVKSTANAVADIRIFRALEPTKIKFVLASEVGRSRLRMATVVTCNDSPAHIRVWISGASTTQ